MTAVAGDHCNVWLLTVTRTSTIKAYEITVTGINATPVLSPITSLPFISSGGSCIMVSPDRKKLTVTQNQPGGLALFDFDLMSGKATSERMLDPRSGYNACFSPDNSKLYISQAQGLFQFDLTGRTLNQIINSRTHIAIANLTHLKAGPDGKIYFQGNPGFLSVLQAPNQPGLTCQPKINEVPLAPGTSMHLGLPNSVPVTPSDTLPDTLFTSRSYNLKCNEELLLAPKQTSGRNFIWHDGVTSSSRLFTQPGTYWVSYRASPPCRYHIDTIIVKAAPTYHHKFTEVICATESYNFNGRLIHQAGTYSDTLFSGTTCDSIITLNLVVLPVPHLVISIEPEGLLCIGDTVVGIASGAKKYQWYNQDQVITDENTAYLPLTNSINQFHVLGIADNTCKDTAAVVVNATECCELFIPNAFSPNNDGTNDRFTVIPNGHLRRFSMQLFNRWGQLIFATNDKHASWDGTYLGAAADAGTYFYIITADCLIDKELMRKGDVLLIR